MTQIILIEKEELQALIRTEVEAAVTTVLNVESKQFQKRNTASVYMNRMDAALMLKISLSTLGRLCLLYTSLVRNTVNNSTRTFEWSNKDSDFIPVVYLDERIHAKNDDGTLCFKAVEQFCHTIFKDEILQEIRPDLLSLIHI